MRLGCGKNLLLETFMASATLSSCLLVKSIIRRPDPGARRAVAASAIWILSMVVFPAAQLLFFNRLGLLSLATQQEYVQRKSLARYLQNAPKPLLTRDEMFSLPWLSTGDIYPAYVILWDIYDTARGEGRTKGGVEELIRRESFGSLLLAEEDDLFQKALQARYRYSSLPPGSGGQSLKILSRVTREKGMRLPP
jgi:hypothetical protein